MSNVDFVHQEKTRRTLKGPMCMRETLNVSAGDAKGYLASLDKMSNRQLVLPFGSVILSKITIWDSNKLLVFESAGIMKVSRVAEVLWDLV